MKILKYYLISFAVILFVTASCQKHDIEFSNQIKFDPTTQAAFIVHHVVPLSDAVGNYIRMVELNGNIIYRTNITTFNGAPSGSAGRYFTAPKGKSNLKLYRGTGSYPNIAYTLALDKDINLDAGQYYNMFVYDFAADPVIVNNGYPYVKDPVYNDSCTYVRFCNFMYDNANQPTTLKLQYKYQNHYNTTEWLNVGKPVSFGETTDWVTIPMKRPAGIVTGAARVDYRIYVVDAAGNEIGRLQQMSSGGTYVDYSDYWNGSIGRRVNHIYCGCRNLASGARADVRTFTSQ